MLSRTTAGWRVTARVRLPATVVPSKAGCTDSDTGRELERTIEDWPRSEITRFYRVLALMLVVLATFIGSVGLVRNHEPAGLVALGGGLVLAARAGQRMVRTVLDQR